MASADEILATMAEETESAAEFVIDNALRVIAPPAGVPVLGVESDDDVHRLHFSMPRYYCGFDLSTFTVRVNYLNAKGEGDIYIVTDAEAGDDTITFSWLVGRHATQYKGTVSFIVCLKRVEDDLVVQEYNTTLATLPVLEGLEVDLDYTEELEVRDILAQLQDILANAGSSGGDGESSGGSGADGYSPTIAVSEIEGGHRLTITDVDGTRYVDVMDGVDGADGSDGQQGPAGADGFSPTITATAIDGGHQLTITDANGTQTINVWDGTDSSGDGTSSGSGADGYSPTITVAEIEGGHRLTITDVNGSRSVDVMDGVDGAAGADGQPGEDGSDGVSATHSWEGTVLTITSASGTSSADLKGETGAAGADGQPGADGVGIQSVEQTTTSAEDNGENVVTVTLTNGSTSTFTVKNGSKGSTGDAGKDGEAGPAGSDGVSATHSWEGTVLTITSASGTSSADLKGETGAAGADGYTPVKGTDYWTTEDQQSIVDAVLAALPAAEGVTF